jgi:hypothetical protein
MKMKRLLPIIVTLVMVFAMSTPAYAVSGNLITNGDFEAGNTGFTTEYNYLNPSNTGTWTLGPEYLYTIGTNPNLYHSAWASFGDHTSGFGKMMIVNGTYLNNETKIVWSQEDISLPAPDPIVTEKILYAGQDWAIGKVLIKNDETGKICVKFVLTDQDAIDDGWIITQAHVAVAANCTGIPQTVKGNPIPGDFPVNETLDPGVTETDWFCLDYNWIAGTPICIAAHAKIVHPEAGHSEMFCVTSNPADTDVLVGDLLQDAVTPPIDPWGSLDTNVNNMPDCPDFAAYLWGADSMTSANADLGGLVNFVQTFTLEGTPTHAMLRIAADNAFAYHFNGGAEVDENLAADWRTQVALGNFDPPDDQGDVGSQAPVVILDGTMPGWSTVYTYTDGDLLASLNKGANTMYVTGLNADWNTTSWNVNPATVIYKLCGEQYIVDEPYDSETGWGEGSNFPGKNWATCISYTPQEPAEDTYHFSMWARSSHPTAPGILELKFGDDTMDTLNLNNNTDVWQELEFDFTVSAETSIDVILRDLRLIAFGDDFCIDDISLVKMP